MIYRFSIHLKFYLIVSVHFLALARTNQLETEQNQLLKKEIFRSIAKNIRKLSSWPIKRTYERFYAHETLCLHVKK